MNRSIWYSQAQFRSFDIVEDDLDTLLSFSNETADILGQTNTVVAGLAATPTSPASLTVNIAAGRIYQLADIDAVAVGAIPQNTNQIFQQGYAISQQVVLSTSGISSGQSRWSLIEAQFSQVDAVRSGDPTAGLLFYYNSANPNQPFQGPNNDDTPGPTVRQGLVVLQVITGAAATTGSEVPPSPTSGWVPLYLIDLSFGQTSITSGEILEAGPSVGTNVPSNYTQAPFLAGLLNQHHLGISGYAPKIDLTAEVKNLLPLANLVASNTSGGGLPVMKLYAGNPNTHVSGNASVNGASDLCYDTTNHILYVCTTTGSASAAVWTTANPTNNANFYIGGTTTGSANAQVLASLSPSSGFSLSNPGDTITCTLGYTNTGPSTLAVTTPAISATPIRKNSSSGLVALSGGEMVAGNIATFTVDASSTYLVLDAGLPANIFLQKANNLSDVASASTARTNLGAAASGANTDITSLQGSALVFTALGVGSICLAGHTGNLTAGQTVAGSTIVPVVLEIAGGSSGVGNTGDTLTGTWQASTTYTPSSISGDVIIFQRTL